MWCLQAVDSRGLLGIDWRRIPVGKKTRQRPSLDGLAHTLARAVYDMLKRDNEGTRVKDVCLRTLQWHRLLADDATSLQEYSLQRRNDLSSAAASSVTASRPLQRPVRGATVATLF